jgi:DNA-binding Lrp family transcriptional regulator
MNKIRKERKNWFYSYNIIFELSISEHAKIVCLYLCRCADEESQSFPSYNTIAKKCSISRRTAIRAVQELEDVGLLSCDKRTVTKNGKLVNTSNLYTIHETPQKGVVPEGHHPSDTESPPLVPEGHHPSDTESPKGLPNEGLPIIKDYSVSQSQSDGQTEVERKEIEDFNKIMAKCHLEYFDCPEAIRGALEDMYFGSGFAEKFGVPKDIVRGRMRRLNRDIIEYAISKMERAAANGADIRNSMRYLQACIYYAITEYESDILADEMLARLKHG